MDDEPVPVESDPAWLDVDPFATPWWVGLALALVGLLCVLVAVAAAFR